MKTGLLILVGGRQVPNVLTAQALGSDIIVPVTSSQSVNKEWPIIKPILQSLCPNGLIDPEEHSYLQIDAYDLKEIEGAIDKCVSQYPGVKWIFNVTCATAVMSIAAFNIGAKYGASIIYLDTANQRVMNLHGESVTANLYYLSVRDYINAYGRSIASVKNANVSKSIIKFTEFLITFTEDVILLNGFLNERWNKGYKYPLKIELKCIDYKNKSSRVYEILEMAQECGMICDLNKIQDKAVFVIPDGQFRKFISGDWLEIYAWKSANEVVLRNQKSLDDCQYGICIPSEDGAKNEIDLAFIYAANLTIAECKTEASPFKTANLDKLYSISNMIGGKFVNCLYIASKMVGNLDKNQKDEFDRFCKQANERRIRVITGEELKELKNIFAQEVEKPNYNRL